MFLLYRLLSPPLSCQLLLTLSEKSADWLFLNNFPMVSQYLLYSILRDGRQSCDGFCCPWWYCQGVVSWDNFEFFSHFWGNYDLHCQVWNMYEALRRVDHYTVIPRKVQNHSLLCQFLLYDDFLVRHIVSKFTFECGCCYLSIFLIGYLILLFENW